MIDRRRFLHCIAVAAAPALTYSCTTSQHRGHLRRDSNRVLKLASGLFYNVISRAGEAMSDGLRAPGAHDGMAAFAGENGRIVLVRNHELTPTSSWGSEYAESLQWMTDSDRQLFYDNGSGITPSLGATTTTVYNPKTAKTERQFLSLAGTDINCAGGKTPWGSWLSCEESFAQPGTGITETGKRVVRDKRHGYVFEVPANATSLVEPHPIKAMGRFEHEAVAVHEQSGVVYLTEDRWYGLFYRYLPNVRGQLLEGGRLQALAIAKHPGQKTHNWERRNVHRNQAMQTRWIDLDHVDSEINDLRKRGAAKGAAMFARGEGLTAAGDRIVFTCTTGGPARLGQVFSYRPSRYEGTDRETEFPGELMLIAQSSKQSLLTNADNLTMAPWGDLIFCEDTADRKSGCSVIGMRPDGSQYTIANNAYSDSELAGVCFSPDGQTMFVNIQYPGMTVAITGQWPR